MSEDGEIVRSVVLAGAAEVLAHGDIQDPVEAVFDAAMGADGACEARSRQGRGEELIGGLGGALVAGLAAADDLADGLEAGPVRSFWSQSMSLETTCSRVSMRP